MTTEGGEKSASTFGTYSCSLMTRIGRTDDVKVPDSELGEQIEKDFEDGKELVVTIVTA